MAQAHEEQPADEAFEAAGSQKMSLIGCPYLGMYKDADTSLAYPHQANHCHRLQSPVGVDLGHQSTYCLSDNYAACYLFGQGEEAPEFDEKRGAGIALSLAALRASLPTDVTSESIRARLPSKVEMPSIRLRRPPWMSLAAIGSRLPSRFELPDLKSILPASLSFAALRSRWPENWNQRSLEKKASSEDISDETAKPMLPAGFSAAAIESRVRGMNKRTVGMIALPLVVLLLIFTAVLWWPSAEPEPDALAMGAAVVKEAALAGDEHAPPAATAPELPARPTPVPESAAAAQPAVVDTPERAVETEEEGTTAVVPDSVEQIELDPATAASDSAILVDSENETSVEPAPEEDKNSVVVTETVLVDNNEAAAVSGEGVTANDGQEVENGADDEIVRSFSPLPAAAIASIGPNSGATQSENSGEGPPVLNIYEGPDSETEILTQLTEFRPAAVLGRDRSAGWILVRLGAGVEGWISASESGVSVVAAELPIISADSESLAFPAAAAPDLPGSSPAENEDLTVSGSAVVNTGALNLRSGPGIDYAPLGFVFNQQVVALFGQYGGEGNLWVLVETSDGQQGWMNSRYLKDISEE